MRVYPFAEKVDFVLKLGTALHKYGIPAQRLEQALSSAACAVGLESQIFSTPTVIMASLRDQEKEVTRIIRIDPGEVDLEKLRLVDKLGDDAVAEKISLHDCSERIDQINALPPPYSRWVTASSQGLSSFGVACIFQAGYADLFWSAIVGFLIGIWKSFLPQSERMLRVYEPVSAFLAAIIASCAHYFDATVSVPTVVLAGLIALLPGLSLTLALTELATQNLMAGTARLTGSGVTLMKLIIGVIVGNKIISLLLPTGAHIAGAIVPTSFVWIGTICTAFASIIIYRAHPQDRAWVVLATITGFVATKLGTLLLGPTLGIFVGGFVIGAGSNLFARIYKCPASIIMVPGIVLLVPGSLGYKSLSLMAQNEVIKGLDSAFDMILIGITIVSGLLLGNVFISPKRSL